MRPNPSILVRIREKGLAMKGFVDKVKAGNWGKTLMAVANLGAAATSVGVSAGVAAAQPLAKDLARGFEDFTVKGLQSAKPVEVCVYASVSWVVVAFRCAFWLGLDVINNTTTY